MTVWELIQELTKSNSTDTVRIVGDTKSDVTCPKCKENVSQMDFIVDNEIDFVSRHYSRTTIYIK